MKSFFLLGVLLAFMLACDPVDQNVATASCQEATPLNANYSKAQQVQQLIDRYTKEGIPGLAVAVYTPQEGYWASASGYANIETKTPMQVCHLQYSQSVAKTYMATAMMKLVEAGKVNLDNPINQYLPSAISGLIKEANQITVRMLLNHTTGLPNYSLDTKYVSFLLQHPLRPFTSDEYLSYISKQALLAKPGSYFDYSDTNYLLLALIADHISGDHARLIRESTLAPLELKQTFYKNSPTYLNQSNLVNSYLDRFGNGTLENVSEMQRVNVSCLKGDDGLIASPTDYIKFLRGLFEGKLVSQKSLTEMRTWIKDKAGEPTYGMGLYLVNHGGFKGYGHGGAGIGAGCGLYYFPDKQLYVFMGTNMGTLTDGPYVRLVDSVKDELLNLLLK
jgi:D-alanyl-D-alanine carboxypeptidase